MKLPPFSAWRLVSHPKHTDTAKVPNYYISRCQLANCLLRVEASKGGTCRLVSGRQSWTIGEFSAGQTLTNPLLDRLPPSKEDDDSRPTRHRGCTTLSSSRQINSRTGVLDGE